MEPESRNIYKTARAVAGLTQERWAEAVGCSVDSVRNYESGTQTPSDEIVRAMSEISGLAPLAYWHLCRKSTLAEDMLPKVDKLPLPQAVVQLLVAVSDFSADHGALLRIAADGTIDFEERRAWDKIAAELDEIVKAALQVKFSEGGDGNGP